MSEKRGWNPSLYKTRLCDFWMSGHSCKYGMKCWYAHGPQEVRTVPHLDSNPLAKTLSSIEVVNMLQPASRDHKNAVHYVSGLMTDPDFFHQFTVPYLNAMALRSMTIDQKEIPTEGSVPLHEFMAPPPMRGTHPASAPLPQHVYESPVRQMKFGLPKDLSASNVASSTSNLSSINGPWRPSSSSEISSLAIKDKENSLIFEPTHEY